jgi:hypothetical protein
MCTCCPPFGSLSTPVIDFIVLLSPSSRPNILSSPTHLRPATPRFCGLTRAQQSSALTVLRSDTPNWVYQYTQPSEPGKWTQILPEPEPESRVGGDGEPSEVPLPRYAHQVVYDEGTKRVYMHGGNAGEGRGMDEEEKENEEVVAGEGNGGGENARTGGDGDGDGDGGNGGGSGNGGMEEERPRVREMRLDDFWVMKLIR